VAAKLLDFTAVSPI